MQSIDIHKVADEARFNRFHGAVLAWCFAILILDGYDLAVAGTALPSIMKEMGVDAKTAGFMASSALFGMMFGAIGLGTLADKIGRRWALSICVFLFSAFTAGAGLTTEPVSFSVMRFFAGLGIGGALPVLTAQLAEYMPKKMRSRMTTLGACGYAVGSILAAVLGKQFIETSGWQSVFFAAGLPVLLIPFILKYLPESMPFLLKKGEDAQLRQIVARIQPGLRLDARQQFWVPTSDKAEGSPIGKLFQDGRGFSTLMFWLAYITCLFMLYALSTWLVKLMAMAGYSLGSALNFLLVYNIGAIVGAVGFGWLADRLNPKWVLFSGFALAAVSLTLLGYGAQPLMLVVGVVGATTLGTQILAYAYTGQYYPMASRSTGVGMASGIGRIGAMLAPIGIGFLVSLNLPLAQNFLAIACAGAAGAVAVALINHRRSASASASASAPQADAAVERGSHKWAAKS